MAVDTGIQFNSVALTELHFKKNKSFVPPKDGIPIEIALRAKNSFSRFRKLPSEMIFSGKWFFWKIMTSTLPAI